MKTQGMLFFVIISKLLFKHNQIVPFPSDDDGGFLVPAILNLN